MIITFDNVEILFFVSLLHEVDGKWTAYGSFSSCSKSCATGLKERTRSCTNPPPRHGGKLCNGSCVDTIECNTHPCPGNLIKKFRIFEKGNQFVLII